MNPQWHDEFVALCALFPSGELTDEEWALLQVHLAYCDSCQVNFREYQHLTGNVIPILAGSAHSEYGSRPETASFSLEASEKRLMSRLDALPTGQESQRRRKPRWQIPAGLIAASLLGATFLIGQYFLHSKDQIKTQTTATTKIESEPKSTVPVKMETDLRPELVAFESKILQLQQQLNTANEQFRQSSSAATGAERQLEAAQSERQRIGEERDSLSQQLTAARNEVQSLRDKSDAANVILARVADLESKLHERDTTLAEKDRMLELDKEFLAHDRDIRDLIGARDLYIADIQDVGQNGKTTKPFGRIFYTKDRSLVFYGYDLDKQAGLKQAVAFQAWGSGDDKQNVSLGLFYQDDSHKRWVLRFNDTKTLARLNMVFVTAEPKGGSAKPTGKPLLLAYLQVQPNHP